ncbi:MAG: hypothetical protein IPI63_06160 [Methanothrix sp.]|jgi:hypothetical protein|uniref:hypothetical protein n=2 Tax=Methanothrix sp. TaxID=90426 RepID=UPI001BD27004|nr:hypothetical protein [Methanothrix sp.]MBK7386320.1 hypothetical protein [Methanothrix sp.]HPW73546.1 hypothetical protein [Methanothrix sp.]
MSDKSSYLVVPFCSDEVESRLGESPQGKYLKRYLRDLGAKTCILEEEYVDKDFLIDFQKFYCRSFDHTGKFTQRLHFFKDIISSTKFKYSLLNDDGSFKESYLGFVVIKPIKDENDQKFIGRTLLDPYHSNNLNRRRFLGKIYYANLFGFRLEINTLPFQAQDQGVSACATIALWAALHPLRTVFGIPGHSPAEITEISTSLPSPFRKFPSSGLTLEQMVNYIKLVGLDVEYIEAINDDVIETVVRAYLSAELPIIADLYLDHKINPGRHAVVISGFKLDKNNKLVELFIHDDGIGPYSRVKPKGNFSIWENEWNETGYEVNLQHLLVPIYPKIRLSFFKMYIEYSKIRDELEKQLGNDISRELELFLTTSSDYKENLMRNSIENKIDLLTRSLPRFLWVIRLNKKEKIIGDLVYDATSVYVRDSFSVTYMY